MIGINSQAQDHMDGKGHPWNEASFALFAGRYLLKVTGRAKGAGACAVGERQQSQPAPSSHSELAWPLTSLRASSPPL